MDEGEDVRVRTTAKAGEAESGRVILNTRELTEQIHLPTPSLSLFFLPCLLFSSFLTPPLPICISLLLLLPPLSSVSPLASYSPN